MKAPLKFSLLRFLMDRPDPATPEEVFEGLKNLYGRERQFSLPFIEDHLDSLRGVGIIKVVEATEAGEKLILSYQATDYGQSRGRYLPKSIP